MVNLTAEATYGSAQPLEVLTKLVGARCKVLYETARDATVATVINALKSIRAATRKAHHARKTNPKIVFRSELIPSVQSLKGGGKRRIFRNDHGHRIAPNKKTRWANTKGVRLNKLHTYLVIPEHEKDAEYLCVAASEKEARAYEDRRSAKRKMVLGGLAKCVLGHTMAKLYAQNMGEDAGVRARQIAPAFAWAATSLHGKELTIEAKDTLDYAMLALKDGRAGVDLALKKAANKTWSYLSSYCSKWGRIEDIGPVPFPEVVKRRAS